MMIGIGKLTFSVSNQTDQNFTAVNLKINLMESGATNVTNTNQN